MLSLPFIIAVASVFFGLGWVADRLLELPWPKRVSGDAVTPDSTTSGLDEIARELAVDTHSGSRCQVYGDARVKQLDGGAWVQAWVYVSYRKDGHDYINMAS
jgi:hypothetical protein